MFPQKLGVDLGAAMEAELFRFSAHGWPDQRLIKHLCSKTNGGKRESMAMILSCLKGGFATRYPLLAREGTKLLPAHATACASERKWSELRWIYRDNRSRLGLKRANKLLTIANRAAAKRKRARGDEDDADFQVDNCWRQQSRRRREEA